MTYPVKFPKKLIEVALPLDAINTEASLRKRKAPAGYATALHKWWAQRPPAAARAVIFAQLVNDPSWKWELEHPGQVAPNYLKASWAASRKRLFKIIEDLVLWENTTNETMLERARIEIRKSWREVCELNKDHPQAAELFDLDKLPAFRDPFAGSGAIPLEAQRLGLEAYASDLNPVAVLINKAMIEIPPKFAGRTPVGPIPEDERQSIFAKEWPRATGLAEDLRHYGAWMREEAKKRIGHFYPPVEITPEMTVDRPDLKPLMGQKLTVIAWLWARTVKSPSPAFSHVDVPLASTFILSSKAGKEVYVQPIVEGDEYHFVVKKGTPPLSAKAGTKANGSGSNFLCIVSNAPISGDYIKSEGQAGRLGTRLLAVVAEGSRGRIYLTPDDAELKASEAKPPWKPSGAIPSRLTGGTCVPYGIKEWGDLFTARQLLALTTFSDLLSEVREKIFQDALTANILGDDRQLELNGTGPRAYSEAISLYIAFAQSRMMDYGCSLSTWRPKDNAMRSGMAKQALPMTWDFAEGNPFGESSSGFSECIEVVAKVITTSLAPLNQPAGNAQQSDAAQKNLPSQSPIAVVSTDPPYYNNIAYADLSDFFYVWLRFNLRSIFSSLFATVVVPKADELVAAPYRHGSVAAAESFFLEGMTRAMSNVASQSYSTFPVTIYYAFKQSETRDADTVSTGWDTFLAAVILAGFSITGTWPMRTEGDNRQVGVGNNALASSIVLVCRKRPADAPTISRRQFIRELNAVLPEALDEMTKGSGDDRSPVAPVDLSQAIIGPGMAVFSKYTAVLEADGTPMRVRTALQLINRFLAEDDFDHDTQFCLHWFDQYGWKDGRFGEADVLARAKATSIGGLAEGGVLRSGSGVVRLLRPDEYPAAWNPQADARRSVWEVLHHLIRAMRREGDSGAGRVLAAIKGQSEAARQLAYRLYTLCERRGWAEDARSYNELITSWTGIESSASTAGSETQSSLFDS